MVARKRTPTAIRDERGQSLIIVVGAMTLLVVLAAFAIDASNWFATHHRAQVTADAMALAAANYMANNPGSTTAPATATTLGESSTYTQGSGVNPTAATVTVDTGSGTVTAHVTTSGPSTFASAVGIGSPTIQTTAVATYEQGTAPYSLFADGTCTSNPQGSISINLNGNATVDGVHSNGALTGQLGNNTVSNTTLNTLSFGDGCSNTLCENSGNCANNPTAPALDSPNNLSFPVDYSSPSCQLPDGGACYFDTTNLSTTCTYVAGVGTPPTNVSYDPTNNAVTITGNVGSAGNYVVICDPNGTITVSTNNTTIYGTLYAQNVIFSGNSPTINPPADDLGIYVTTNTTLNLDPGNGNGNGSNSVLLNGAYVFAPNATVDMGGNNGSGFVEAWSIAVSGNSWTFKGTGPTDPNVFGDHLVQ